MPLDQHPEQGRSHRPDRGADRVEQRDGERPDLERKHLAHREIGRARRRRGEEEHRHPAHGQGRRGDDLLLERPPAQRQQHPRHPVGRGDHGFAAERVEQPSEQHRTEEVAGGEGQDVPADPVRRHLVEVDQDQRVGEEDRVVEERLRRHQREADPGPLPVGLEGGKHLGERRVAALAQPRLRERAFGEGVALGAEARLDPGDQGLGLLVPAVGHQPARALGDPGAQKEDHEPEEGAEPEGDAPARIRSEQGGIEHDERGAGPEHRAEPEAAVDDEIGPAPGPGRDQLLDGRVDRRVLAADARAGEEAEEAEAPQVPGQAGGGGGREVDRQRDEEELFPPEPVGEPAEADGAEHRAGEVARGREPDLGVGELERRARLERAGERARQRHLEPVEHPGDAERQHHQRVEPAPGQPVEPGRDVGLDHAADGGAGGGGVRHRGPSL